MKKFEHKIEFHPIGTPSVDECLDRLGEKGYELVAVINFHGILQLYFKKEKQ